MYKKIKFYGEVFKKFGIRALLFLLTSKLKRNKIDNIRLSNVKFPIHLSYFGTDVTTMFQIFYNEEYKVDLQQQPKAIIDCGANIGLSAVYFANKYPSAKIVAVEPDKNNFSYLVKNTANYKNVICLNNAIWSHLTMINIVDQNTGNWGLKTVETQTADNNSVAAITIDSIMQQHNMQQIDLLKIDIEGAEKELFSQNYQSWLSKTKALAIELHDEEGNNTISNIFFKAIEPYPHKTIYQGENLICYFN